MASTSIEQRLTDALEQRIDELDRRLHSGDAPPSIADLLLDYRLDLRKLRRLGSGPLPSWARRRALELGIDVDSRTATTSTT